MKKCILGIVALLAALFAAGTLQADPVLGPDARLKVVAPQTTDIYTVSFYGNEWARVRVVGDGSTDLDVYVLDEFGNVVGSDTDYTDNCAVLWLPQWTGRFTIRVVNCGSVSNLYLISVD